MIRTPSHNDARQAARSKAASSRRTPKLSHPLNRAFTLLSRHFGPQRWWPGDTPFEVCVGAILTQNTAWTNVEKAIASLRRARVLTPQRLRALRHRRLAALIRSAGYFNVKARRLRAFLDFLHSEFGDNLPRMFRTPTAVLRETLLAVNGIGPETADSILLYAGGHESFVVDAYTRRILARHGWAHGDTDYHEVKALFEQSLPAAASRFTFHVSRITFPTGHPPSGMSRTSQRHSSRARIFNEYHALIVAVGKHYCLAGQPKCENCPLRPLLPKSRPR
ncbi:MAG: endonuclease III domain-containing protein [Verrucomicrobia bacterium]|nr:endonuclease III domain-containing protein [Verrucomicrobiota bacterium]